MGAGRFKLVLWNKGKTFAEMRDMQVSMALKYDWVYFHSAQETCPTTKQLHVDSYYEMKGNRKVITELNKFNKVFGKGFGDLQIARGTAGENIDYSEKEQGTFYTQGTRIPNNQGERTDLTTMRNKLVAGETTADDILWNQPESYHQYGRTLSKLEDLVFRKKFRTEMTQGIWLHGPTGTGKSHEALSNYNPETHYLWKLDDKGWQDGYIGQETVIINEFRGSIPYNTLLEMVDKWPYFVPRRGREPAPFLAKTVIITSSLAPDVVYHNRQAEDSLEQFNRRFKVRKLVPVNQAFRAKFCASTIIDQ